MIMRIETKEIKDFRVARKPKVFGRPETSVSVRLKNSPKGRVFDKKAWPEDFEKILSGDKTFELRLADWECKVGDALVLREWDPLKKEYTGRVIEKRVTYVVRTKDQRFFPKEEVDKHGFQVIGFK